MYSIKKHIFNSIWYDTGCNLYKACKSIYQYTDIVYPCRPIRIKEQERSSEITNVTLFNVYLAFTSCLSDLTF